MEERLRLVVGEFVSSAPVTATTTATAATTTDNNNSEQRRLATVPDFLAHLLVARWPRRQARAIESSNRLLFAVQSAALGWTQFLGEASAANQKSGKNNNNKAVAV